MKATIIIEVHDSDIRVNTITHAIDEHVTFGTWRQVFQCIYDRFVVGTSEEKIPKLTIPSPSDDTYNWKHDAQVPPSFKMEPVPYEQTTAYVVAKEKEALEEFELLFDVKRLIADGKRIEAVRKYREEKSTTHTEARQFIDDITIKMKEEGVLPASTFLVEEAYKTNPSLVSEVEAILWAQRPQGMINAVKRVRVEFSCGIVEAKYFVERVKEIMIERGVDLDTPSSGLGPSPRR